MTLLVPADIAFLFKVVVHRAPALLGQQSMATHCVEQPLQYKLEESGPQYFAKGTGKGFL